jgi:hypothetical protein
MEEKGASMKSRFCFQLILATAFAIPSFGQAGAITTPQIVAQTIAAAPACMRWTPVGLCFWLHCN